MRISTWPTWKKTIGLAVCVLIAADLLLIGLLWRASIQGPEAMRQDEERLELEAKLLRADVARGEKIRASLPQVGRDSDAFYQQAFLDNSTGYSQIDADLSDIAKKAGVNTDGFGFNQKVVKGRGVTEVTITTSVDADYPAIIQFINGLELAKHFYLVDQLHLSSATPGTIRLNLELHTYFRT
jgi:Tfp pilus assembly protein PilO